MCNCEAAAATARRPTLYGFAMPSICGATRIRMKRLNSGGCARIVKVKSSVRRVGDYATGVGEVEG